MPNIDLIDTEPYVILKFSKDNCPGCDNLDRFLTQHQDKLSHVTMVPIKLESDRPIFQEFAVRAAPTMILFRNGDEVYRLTGFNDPHATLSALDLLARN